jgi:hypothetical protein
VLIPDYSDDGSILLRMMVYGVPGAGKTTFASTFDDDPRTSRVLIVDVGGNSISIRKNSPKPLVLIPESLNDIDRIFAFCLRQKPDDPIREALGIDSDVKINTVVIDTLSEVQRMAIHEERGVAYATDSAYQAGVPLSIRNTPTMRIQDWGGILQKMTTLASMFYKLPIHVIITCQEKLEIEEEDGKIISSTARPFLQGGSADAVPAWATLIGRITRRPVPGRASVPFMQFTNTTRWYGKNQVSLTLPNEIQDPTASKILDAVIAG